MPTQTLNSLPSREAREELAQRAQAFYEPLRERLEKEHGGDYITIHPDNGDYAVSPIHWEAVKAMHARYPEVLFYTIRIGYRAVAHFGGRGASDGRRK